MGAVCFQRATLARRAGAQGQALLHAVPAFARRRGLLLRCCPRCIATLSWARAHRATQRGTAHEQKFATAAQTPINTNRFDAYSVRDYEANGEKKSDWTRIGVAFSHADGKGFNVLLQALPFDGKMVLRVHEPKEDGAD